MSTLAFAAAYFQYSNFGRLHADRPEAFETWSLATPPAQSSNRHSCIHSINQRFGLRNDL